jgi:serine/threonine protein kinase/WD40 repeat protein
MSTDFRRVQQILAEAVAISSPAERAAYVAQACGADAELRQEVERLLKAHELAGDFLEQPVIQPEAAIVGEGPGSVIGRYKLLEQIGEGGLGRVFMAEQTEPVRRTVALKIIKAGMDTREVIARFEAERQALALMDHPNIARVLDGGATETGRPYFVMELVKGIPITEYCDQNELSTADRLQLFMKVCHAVQHAHQKGIIHRDLKPTNILVTLIDGEAVPKVIDFGVAKALGQKLTEKTLFTAFRQMIGTPAYMSPEQAQLSGVDVDTRSDIYSLGVLLYELLTGVTPFDQEMLHKAALDEVRRLIRETEPPKPSTRLRTLGDKLTDVAKHRHADPAALPRLLRGDLDWIVMRCLEKDRQRRYETANGLAEDVERHLEHQPVEASPPSMVYRARKFIRRHRVGVALSATAVGALLVGLSVAVVGFVQARQQRDRAMTAEQLARRERDRAVTAEQQTEQERNRVELLAAEAALAKGQTDLEAGNHLGLLDMVDAFGIAKHHPVFQEIVGRRWSTWHAYWSRLTIVVRRMSGTFSPDHLQHVSISDWPPDNTSRVAHMYDTLRGAEVTKPLMHDSVAVGCAFSADGRLFATLTQEGVIHIWERETGSPARTPCPSGVTGLESLAFSPCGRYLVAFSGKTGAGQSEAALLRLDEPQGRAHILDHRYPINDARFSPDGELLAVLCKPRLHLWRTSDLQPLGSPLAVKFTGLLEFSPDGTRLAFNPQGTKGIGLLDTRTQQIIRTLPKEGSDATSAAFSHDGRLLACFDWDGNLEIWDTESGARPYPAQKVGGRMWARFTFNRDDSLLAVGDSAGRIHVLRTSDGTIAYTFQVRPYAHAAFLANGVLAGQALGYVNFWDLAATPLRGSSLVHDALAWSLAFDSSGRVLAVGGEGELRLWLMQPTPTLERTVIMPGRVVALTFSEADRRFVAFTDDGSITMVEPDTGRTTTRGNCGRGYQFSASLSPDGRRLALFRYTEFLVVNTQTGAVQPIDDKGGTLSVAFRPDSTAMAVGSAGWSVTLYDTTSETNAPVGAPAKFEGWVGGLTYHPGGSLLAVYVEAGGIHLYDFERKRTIGSVRSTSLNCLDVLRFSGDGSLLAVAGPTTKGGYAVELWHVDPQRGLFASGLSLLHDHPIWSIAFSPDNRTLVVGGNGTTRLWQLPSTPKDLKEIQSQTWATLGFRRNAQGGLAYVKPPPDPTGELRARLTKEAESSVTPLDAALKLAPATAQAAIEKLADEYPAIKVYQSLLGRAHADLCVSNAEHGLWAAALVHADEAIRTGHDEPLTHYWRALCCLAAGDVEGYRATCRTMAARYKSSNDPDVVKWVGWSAALAPGALDDYADIIEQLRRAAPRVGGWHGPAYRFYLGAVLLRSGQYREAVAELEQVDRHTKAEGAYKDSSPICIEFLLAMCHARLGNDATARQRYETGRSNVSNLREQEQGTVTEARATSWDRRLTFELLRKEAESVLNSPAPPPTGR